MAAEKFFTRVANDVLEASEKLSARLEEGLSALMTGELPLSQQQKGSEAAGQQQEQPPPPVGGGDGTGGASAADGGGGEGMYDDPEMRRGSPLEGIAETVIGDIFKGQGASGPQTPWEHFQAFRHAITWQEPFILALLAFQVLMFCACLYVSRRDRGLAPRLVVMVTIGIIVRGSERINEYAAEHWESFATQNYFDGRGVFASVVLCAPLLADCFLMLTLFVKEAGQLLIQVKTAELKKKKNVKASKGDGSKGDNNKKRRAKKEM